MNVAVAAQLAAMLAPLSLVAVGGALTIIPEVHRQVVEVYGWLSDVEFAELFALAQVAPGPNILVVSLIGWRVAGWLGAFTALLAFTLPSSVLTFGVAHARSRLSGARWLMALQSGLAPIAVGLVLASGYLLGSGSNGTVSAYLLTAVTIVVAFRTKLHPLLLMLVGAGLAAAGLL
jgi:chromate transporter